MDSFRRGVLSTSIVVLALTCAAFAPSALARAGDRPFRAAAEQSGMKVVGPPLAESHPL